MELTDYLKSEILFSQIFFDHKSWMDRLLSAYSESKVDAAPLVPIREMEGDLVAVGTLEVTFLFSSVLSTWTLTLE